MIVFEVACGNCQGRLLVQQTGIVVACPHCGTHLTIGAPTPAPAPPPPAPVPYSPPPLMPTPQPQPTPYYSAPPSPAPSSPQNIPQPGPVQPASLAAAPQPSGSAFSHPSATVPAPAPQTWSPSAATVPAPTAPAPAMYPAAPGVMNSPGFGATPANSAPASVTAPSYAPPVTFEPQPSQNPAPAHTAAEETAPWMMPATVPESVSGDSHVFGGDVSPNLPGGMEFAPNAPGSDAAPSFHPATAPIIEDANVPSMTAVAAVPTIVPEPVSTVAQPPAYEAPPFVATTGPAVAQEPVTAHAPWHPSSHDQPVSYASGQPAAIPQPVSEAPLASQPGSWYAAPTAPEHSAPTVGIPAPDAGYATAATMYAQAEPATSSAPSSRSKRGVSRGLFLLLVNYASLATIAAAYLAWLAFGEKADQAESLPDVEPRLKGNQISYQVAPPEHVLPPKHILTLGASQRFGNLLVTPLKVTRGEVEFERLQGGNQGLVPVPENVLKLWIKFENVSSDQEIAPLRSLAFKQAANNFVCQQSQKTKKGHKVWPAKLDKEPYRVKDHQIDKTLKPGESYETFIPTQTVGVDRMLEGNGSLVWRVWFRKGYSPNRYGVTTLIDVTFSTDDIENEA